MTTAYEKDNRKERKEILEKNNMITIKIRKKIMNNQWIENISIIKKSRYSNKSVEKENYIFIVTKRDIKSRNAEFYRIKQKNQQKHKWKQLQ